MQGDWYVYLVRGRDYSLYAGATADLYGEVERLNAGRGSPYGRLKGPVRLVYWERKRSQRAAVARAAEVRRLPTHHKQRLVLGERGSLLWGQDQIGGAPTARGDGRR